MFCGGRGVIFDYVCYRAHLKRQQAHKQDAAPSKTSLQYDGLRAAFWNDAGVVIESTRVHVCVDMSVYVKSRCGICPSKCCGKPLITLPPHLLSSFFGVRR